MWETFAGNNLDNVPRWVPSRRFDEEGPEAVLETTAKELKIGWWRIADIATFFKQVFFGSMKH